MQELAAVLKAARDNARQVDADAAFPRAAVDALRGSGLLGLTLPADVGGMGRGPEEFADVLTQLAAACGSTAMVYLMHVSAAMAVAAAAPPGRPDLLRRLANGDLLTTLALSETGSRSHFWAPVSQAEVDGDTIRLKVRKSWVTSADHADVYVVSSLTPPSLAPSEGASDLYVVDAATEGVAVAGTWHGMGLRGNASAPMTFDLPVPQSDRLGAPGAGLGLIGLGSQIIDMADFSDQLALMIGLGVGVDYALFIVTRYRESYRANGGDVAAAVEGAMNTAGRAVLFAGATVVIALLGMFALGVNLLNGVAIAAALGVVMVLAASLTLLPALLVLVGRRIGEAGRTRAARAGDRPGFWAR